jgi:hypothetical protein
MTLQIFKTLLFKNWPPPFSLIRSILNRRWSLVSILTNQLLTLPLEYDVVITPRIIFFYTVWRPQATDVSYHIIRQLQNACSGQLRSKTLPLWYYATFPGKQFISASYQMPIILILNKKKLRGLVRQRTIPTERPPLVGEVSANLADRGCRVVSATNPHGH